MERVEKALLLLNKPIGMIAAIIGFTIGILLVKMVM